MNIKQIKQSSIIDILDDLRTSNTYVHNELLNGIEFNSSEFKSRPVYLVETLAAVNALVPNGTMLLYGGHGGGKTTLCKILGQIFTNQTSNQIESAMLRAHPQLTEEKILGSLNLKQMLDPSSIPDDGNIEVQWNAFVESQWKIVDEVNRLSHYAQNILLSLLAEGVVKYQNKSKSIHGYTVFATMNPKDEGNVELPMPFMDRFALALPITMPDYASMQTIGKKNKTSYKPSRRFSSQEDLNDIQDDINSRIRYEAEAEEFVNTILADYRVCLRTAKEASEKLTVDNGLCGAGDNECHYTANVCSKIKNPLSVRVKEDLFRYGKALAWFLGDSGVNTEHIKAIAPYMIWHRSSLSKKFQDETIENNFKKNKFYINPELEGTKKIIGLIYDRFKIKYSKFLKPINNAHTAKVSSDELNQLIEECEEVSDDDLLIQQELLPELKQLKENMGTIKEYMDKIDKADTHDKLNLLQKKLKREYQIKNRQLLSKKIYQKRNQLKIDTYNDMPFKIADSRVLIDFLNDNPSELKDKLISIYGDDYNFVPHLAKKDRLTSSNDEYDLDVTPRRKTKDKIELTFIYRGSKNTEIFKILKQL